MRFNIKPIYVYYYYYYFKCVFASNTQKFLVPWLGAIMIWLEVIVLKGVGSCLKWAADLSWDCMTFGLRESKTFVLRVWNICLKGARHLQEHLSTQGKLISTGGLHCFLCPNKIWTSPFGASDALKILKNVLELRKLQPLKVKVFKNWKNKP
jgi:hypothetical protein